MKSTNTPRGGASALSLSLHLSDAICELSDRQRALQAIETLIGYEEGQSGGIEINRNDLTELVMAVNRSISDQLGKVTGICKELHSSLRNEQ